MKFFNASSLIHSLGWGILISTNLKIMKTWCQFYQHVGDKIAPCLGSDAVFILDGRNSIKTMKEDCEERIRQLKNCHKYVAYRIYRGEHFYEDNPLTPMMWAD